MRYCLLILANLAVCQANHPALMSEALPTLAAFGKHRDVKCRQYSIFALGNLCSNSENLEAVVQAGCLKMLIRYAFPSTLAYDAERGASGANEVAELNRILATRPPVIVTMDEPMAPWNPATHSIMTATLARSYRQVLTVPREDAHLLVYLRRDLPLRR